MTFLFWLSLEENLVQSSSTIVWWTALTFQLDNNLKHKAKSTLELLTMKTVPLKRGGVRFSSSFKLKLWQDLKMVV